jgi:hypothetical protein
MFAVGLRRYLASLKHTYCTFLLLRDPSGPVLDGVRKHLAARDEAEHPPGLDGCDLIERHVDRIVKPEAVEVRLLAPNDECAPTDSDDHGRED